MAMRENIIGMKILWVCGTFLHPTTKGGQIRTLEMLKRLHQGHEIHYLAYQTPGDAEGLARASEYSTRAYAIPHHVPPRGSVKFFGQLAGNLLSELPLSVSRYAGEPMRAKIAELRTKENFDSVVCDFLFPAPNFEDLSGVVLFEHNVESMIWKRHVEASKDPLRKAYFSLQCNRMLAYEKKAVRQCAHVIAVSPVDARKLEQMFSVPHVSDVKTGVDTGYFDPPRGEHPHVADMVFVGSMDWMPNIDGVNFFTSEVLPLIRKQLPNASLAVVGRTPGPEIRRLAETGQNIVVTGTVADIRPYLWGSAVSIVPLRIGSGTRLKIYESMAAKTAVVSTTIGAEGLIYEDGKNIAIADSPEQFAARTVELLKDAAQRNKMAQSAFDMVAAQFSWEQVTREFEALLAKYPARRH